MDQHERNRRQRGATETRRWISDAMREELFRIRHRENVTLLAMGDSSVFGVGDHGDRIPAVGAGWTGRLAHDIGAERFINVAKNGVRARDLMKSQFKAAYGMRPTLVLLCIGTNDVLRGDFSPREIEDSLRRLVRELKVLGSITLFLGLPDPIVTAPGPIALRRILHRRVILVNAILIQVAREEDGIFVGTWHLPYRREDWHVDRMHPSPQGHQNIANHIRSELALIKCSREILPTSVQRSKHFEKYWLITSGLKWFLKRSIDLVPALIWLVVSESIRVRGDSDRSPA